jgi:hypothetical protein
MCTMVYVVYYGMETTLFVLMIFSCSYLCLLSFRSRLTMPIMDLDRKTYFESQNLRLDTNGKHLAVNDKYQKGEENNGENGYSIISNCRYSDIVHESNNNTTSSNASEENLPFVSIVVPARNEEDYIEDVYCLYCVKIIPTLR